MAATDVKDYDAVVLTTAEVTSMKRLMTTSMKHGKYQRSGRGQAVSVRTRVCAHTSSSGVAGVAYSTVGNLTPGSADGFNSFALLFDECRCHGVKVAWKTALIAGSMTGTGYDAHGIVTVDPATVTALGSIAAGMELDHRSGVGTLSSFGGLAPFDAEKWIHVDEGKWVKLPVPVVESGLTADLVGGGWFPCSASTSAIVGYLKPFLEASTNPGTAQFRLMLLIEYDMEFRNRG